MTKQLSICAAIVAALACGNAAAATITVTAGGDAGTASTCTLRQALAAANSDSAAGSACVAGSGSDTIVFDPTLANSTITLATGALGVSSSLTLTGSGQVIDGNNASTVLSVSGASSQVTISDVTVQHGYTTTGGGGIQQNDASLTLQHVTVQYNQSRDNAAGIVSYQGSLTLSYCAINSNHIYDATHANGAGGLFFFGNTLSVDHSQFSFNTFYGTNIPAVAAAGGVSAQGDHIHLNTSTISGNVVVGNSGYAYAGVYITRRLVGNDCQIVQSTLANNQATIGATSGGTAAVGGIGINGCGTVGMQNVTLAQNHAYGGHYAVGGLSSIGNTSTLSNITVSANTATLGTTQTGGIRLSAETSNLVNSILSNNSGLDPDLRADGTIAIKASLLGTALQATWAGNGNIFTDAPGLGALNNYGGPTATMALLLDSPAINAGNNALIPAGETYDQRGAPYARISGASVDMGAFELQLTPGSERQALIDFYLATAGDGWSSNANWCNGACPANGTPTFNAPGTECTWSGVTCSPDGHVTALNFQNNLLNGSLPSLQAFTQLTSFDVSVNQLHGVLPSLAGLTQLTSLVVSHNTFSGPLPALANLANLQTVDANSNRLTGPIPSLTGMTALQSFNVSVNELTGSIPSVAGLSALQYFRVSENLLSGGIPSLSGLTNLQVFDAQRNALSGALPSLAGLAQLNTFYVNANLLSGSIPSVSGLANLANFDVDGNRLTGNVPSLAGLGNAVYVSFADNALSGGFPDLSGTTKLAYLDLSYNQLSGALPADLSAETSLANLYVQSNRFTGGLPIAPASLLPHQSYFCPNLLTLTAGPNDGAWNTATGQTPWWGPPGGGCDAIAANGFQTLTNGSFETGLTGWHVGGGSCLWETASAGVITAGYAQWAAATPVDGSYELISDGQNYGECTLYQDVHVPSGVSSARFSAAVGYDITGGDPTGCNISVALTTPAGSLVAPYIQLSGSAQIPLTQYAPITFGVQPGDVLRILVTTTNTCQAYPATIALDNVDLTLM